MFNTGPYGILKIGLRHVLSWPKLGSEPTFHDPGTFGGFGKMAKIRVDNRKGVNF